MRHDYLAPYPIRLIATARTWARRVGPEVISGIGFAMIILLLPIVAALR